MRHLLEPTATGAILHVPDVGQYRPLPAPRFRILPVGPKPADLARLVSAVADLLDPARDTHYSGELAHHGLTTEILVPVAGDADIEQVGAQLTDRVVHPVPPGIDIVVQTSGSTTGRGHLVGLSASALRASAYATLAHLGGYGRWVIALPLHHIAGLQMVTRSVLAGIPPILVDTSQGFDIAAFTRALERGARRKDAPLYTSLVPTQLERLLAAGPEAVAAARKADAVLVGGAQTAPGTVDRALAAGIKVITTYGMTETAGGCVYDGMPLAGTQVATIQGRVWISGTTLMTGYLDEPNTPVLTFDARRRWLITNDLGQMHGPRLAVSGRIDDVIITGGVKVQANAVARAVAAVDGVAEAAVVGVDDRDWGKLVTAIIVIAPDADPALARPLREIAAGKPQPEGGELPDDLAVRIRNQVAAELGRAHAPRAIIVTDRISRIGLDKIDRQAVTAFAAQEIAAGRAWLR